MSRSEEPPQIPEEQRQVLSAAAALARDAFSRCWPDGEVLEATAFERPFVGFRLEVKTAEELIYDDLRRLQDVMRTLVDASEPFHFALVDMKPPERPRFIYGVAHSDEVALRRAVARYERALERDAVVLGKQLELFLTPGGEREAWVWLPRGTTVRNLLIEELRAFRRELGFHEVVTPPVSGDACRHAVVYASKRRGADSLPLRFHELVTVGQQTHDEATVFLREEQLEVERAALLDATRKAYQAFDLDSRLSQRHGAEFLLPNAHGVHEHAAGRLHVAAGVAEAPDLTYVEEGSRRERPLVLSHSIYGSVERFLCVVLEQCGGDLPFWLAPVQVRVVPLSWDALPYCESLLERLRVAGLRSELDRRGETPVFRRRAAYLDRVPYALTAGPREAETGGVSVYTREAPQTAREWPFDRLLEELRAKEDSRGAADGPR